MDEDKQRYVAVAILALIYFISAIHALEKDVVNVVVSLQHGGRVQGSVMTSSQGHNFYAFRGIPYAEPPVGELRFKPPVPKAPWSDYIMDATADGPACPHINFLTKQITGNEDCLRVNIYTRELPGVEKSNDYKAPVMVFIYGGGFMMGEGTSHLYSPVLLMDSDIVLVTLNYRVSALGFLSTGDEAAPGNYGLQDQSSALKWIQENIEAFGGNPDQVTIFGESAGAASVSHHILSPLSQGLFHGAIAMSGATSCSWAIQDDVSYWSKKLGKDVNCPTDNNQELVACLRKKPLEDIISISHSYMKMSFFPLPFIPSVDGYFLPDHPLKLLRSPDKLNKVPVISGICDAEGAFFLNHILSGAPVIPLTSPEFQTQLIDIAFSNPTPVKMITKLVKDAYFNDIDANNETQVESAIINAMSDGMFDICHYETTSMMSKAGLQVFAYSFDHEATYSFSSVFGSVGRNFGVGHGDDLLMVFPILAKDIADRDKDMSRTMIKIWTNFAKYGTPIPENDKNLPKWPPIKDDSLLNVYHFNEPITVQTVDLNNNKKYKFWTKDIRKVKQSGYTRKEEL